jgi:hypothetical protein
MNRRYAFFVGIGLSLGTCVALTGCAPLSAPEPGTAPPTVTVSYPLQRPNRAESPLDEQGTRGQKTFFQRRHS